jgi:hypothetical protein
VASHWRILGGGDHFLPRADRRRAKRCVCVMKGLRRPSNDARRGAVRLNSILPVCAPGHGGAPLFLLMNCHSARQVLSPKMAYTHLP